VAAEAGSQPMPLADDGFGVGDFLLGDARSTTPFEVSISNCALGH
jgi:hypothetical protein